MGEQQPQQRKKGTVKWFNATKGFGFITPDEEGEDLFVHQTSIEAEGFRSLREGEEVEFEVEQSDDGRTKAIKVTGPAGAAPQGAPRRSGYRGGGAVAAGGPPFRGGGRGRGRIPDYNYGYYDYNYYAYYAYPPRGAFRGRGGFRGGRGGRLPGRGMYPPGPQQAGECSGLQVVVHNLPWSTTWQQLKDVFKEWKVERADVVYDSWGKSRGFGTVRFQTKEDADAACNKVNNTEVEGRTITVRLDRYA